MTLQEELLGVLLAFPPIVEATVHESAEVGGSLIELTWMVSLPKKYERAGESSTGVRESEKVYLRFPPNYPSSAPKILLRQNFPVDLPHIYPHRTGDLVPPCVSEVPLSELLHSQGLQAVLEATDEWLKNAAANELHDPVQGWDPIRRDNGNGIIVVDASQLRNDIRRCHTPASYSQVRYFVQPNEFSVGAITGGRSGTAIASLSKISVGKEKGSRVAVTPALIVATMGPNEAYLAERVGTFEELTTFAGHFGLEDVLLARCKYVLQAIVKTNHKHHSMLVDGFFVILAIRRPYPIIGTGRDIELLAYRVDVQLTSSGKLRKDSPCYPVVIQDVCTPKLLRSVSGTQQNPVKDLTVVGSGSLGSKMALHLAKTGNYKFQLIDHDTFSMHNNARHGLTQTDIFSCYDSKAELLENAIRKLGICASSLPRDVRFLCPSKDFKVQPPGGYVIDTTASLAVRHFLSHEIGVIPGRLIQTFLLNRAKLGIVAVEGIDRNPRIDDMNALVYQMGVDEPRLREAIYEFEGPSPQRFAEGCGSFTTQMTDIDISIPAAIMSAQVDRFISQKEPGQQKKGQLSLSLVEDDFSSVVNTLSVPQTSVFSRENNGPWEIRLIGSVAAEISEQAAAYPGFENGGFLIGQYDSFSNTVYVSGLMAAPVDTIRAKDRFTLGTEGVEDRLIDLATATHGKIMFVGTWHSHPNAEPPSSLDRTTMRSLQAQADLPVVMLVHTGGRIECIAETFCEME